MPDLRASRILSPELETRPPDAHREFLSTQLARIVGHAYQRAPRFRRALDEAAISPAEVKGVDDLERLPILRKDDLLGMQSEEPPFGGLLAVPPERLARIFMSPGPLFDPQGIAEDFWRFKPALAAAGFRAGDIVQNAAAYHLTPLGFMLDSALRGLGCVVIPAGPGQTELQIRIAAHVGVTGYVGLPGFLRILLTKAREAGARLRIEVAFVIGEMFPESLRSELEEEFGVRVLQGYGTADLGCLAYECPEKGGWHLHPEAIVEVLDLETGKAAAPGQPGQIVATLFDEAYPLVRFATGDLSALAPPAPCPCGRTAPKLQGLLGRVGDAVKVKGMFVRWTQVDEVMKKFPAVKKWQAVVTREGHADRLTYRVELEEGSADQSSTLAEALREAVIVRGEVEIVPADTVPPGAKKIDDRREWK
jgi:phenylacetate-CoA ligase